MSSTIKVILADDHAIFRQGVRSLLETEPDIDIVAEASDAAEALDQVKKLSPHVIMIDITMPGMSGLEASEIICRDHPETRSLILSMHNIDDYIMKAVENGAHGYLLKDTSRDEMLKAIRTVASGEKYFSGTVSGTIVGGYLEKIHPKTTVDSGQQKLLSRKEKTILQFIIDGMNSREIAEKLNLSIRTIDNHRANMMKKMNVRNAAELVKLAFEKRLV